MDSTKPSEDQTQPVVTPTTDEPVVETPTETKPADDAPSVPVADAPVVPTPVPTPVAEEQPAVGDDAAPSVAPPSKEKDETDTSGSAGTGGATV